MKPVTRYISSSFFILLVLIPVLFVVAFSLKQQSIHKEMKERMETKQLHTIVLANDEIQWAKFGKEIWIEGKMFDIKSITSNGGYTTFKGLFDDEETILKRTLNKDWEKSQKSQNHLVSQLFQSLRNIYFTNIYYPFKEETKTTPKLSFSASKLISQYLEIQTPPPLS